MIIYPLHSKKLIVVRPLIILPKQIHHRICAGMLQVKKALTTSLQAAELSSVCKIACKTTETEPRILSIKVKNMRSILGKRKL